ncbi:MAG TPA: serine/threonine phosphatase [Coleofasciculaceae cyanobacterium]
MLVCPHCQFDNPDTHKFCQKCGESLTEKECPACKTSVAFETEYCPNCGTATGTVWRALLVPSRIGQPVEGKHQPIECEPVEVEPASSSQEAVLSKGMGGKGIEGKETINVDTLLKGKYLDRHLRYQILSVCSYSENLAEAKVLDCQPLQSSLLDVCYDRHSDTESISDMCQTLDVPPAARPYLDLRQRYPALPLPQVHDAWEQDGVEVVLLEDWTTMPLLLNFWQDEQVLPMQILYWLHEMIELWAMLQTKHCCQSLLVLDNLRVDEDHLLCLQRLYPDSPEQPPVLQDLGRLWQTLFQRSQRTQRGDLARLYNDLEAGIVNSLEQLRSRIEEIATALQPELTTMVTPPNAPEPLNPFMMDDTNLDGETFFRDDSDSTEPVTAPLEPGILPPLRVPDLKTADSALLLEQETTLPLDSLADAAPEPPTASDEDTYSEGDDSPTIVLPMRLVSLEDAGATDIGRQRDHNEDCFSIQTEIKKLEGSKGRALHAKGLYILCDGMGGHAGGEVASALAVETLQNYFAEHWQGKLPSYEVIRVGIHQANTAIYNRNQENARSGSGRMGTTLVLVLIQDTEVAIAHVGDSRLYRFSRRRGLELLTVDHEVGQREIQRGVEPAIAYARPDAYQLTQALGPRDENFVSPDIRFLELNEDMLLLLCSDGLTDNNLLEAHWRTHLEPLLSSQNNLEQGVHQLIDLANQQNGHDNITAIAIRAKVRPNLDQFDPR